MLVAEVVMNEKTEGQRIRRAPGLSITRFCKETGLPYKRTRAAIDAGEIRVGRFGGVLRIMEGEPDRILQEFGAPAE
jgi:hypothetical protein